MNALNGLMNGFGSGEVDGEKKGIETPLTFSGAGLNIATSASSRTGDILSMSAIPDSNDILSSIKPDRKIFTPDEDAKIRIIYNGDTLGVTNALAAELCKNLGDEQGERTPNFQALVSLGLLDKRNISSLGSETQSFPIPGCDLLTPKGALFLGIDWAKMRTIGHIKDARNKHRKQVIESQTTLHQEVRFAELCTQLIQQEQTALGRVFIPYYDYVNELRQIFAQVHPIMNPGTPILDSFGGVEDACKLGWLPEEWWKNKKTGSNMGQVNSNFLKFLEESKKLFGFCN